MLKGMTRTTAVFLGGVLLSVVASGALDSLLSSNGEIVKMYTAQPNNPHWTEILRNLRHSALISVYLVGPLVGLVVGVFVGLLQKTWILTVAASCLVPDFVFGFFADDRKVWARSLHGILVYAVDHSLPFVAAILAAALCHLMVSRRQSYSVNAPGTTSP